MAWIKPSAEVDDLVQLLASNTSPPSLTLLRAKRTLTSRTAVALARALAPNTSLLDLCIAGHDIGEEGSAAFADALRVNGTLVSLQIGHAQFGDKALAALCRHGALGALRRLDLARRSLVDLAPLSRCMAVLEDLDLSHNALADTGLHALALGVPSAMRLKALRLDCVGATPGGAAMLALALRSRRGQEIDVLSLAGNASLGPAGVVVLGDAPARALVLDGCAGGDEGALAIIEGRHRVHLSMNDCGVTAEAAAGMARALAAGAQPLLEALSLARNGLMGDTGAEALAGAVALARLDLSLTGATRIPAGLLSRVDALMFMGNEAGDEAALASAIMQGSLRQLSLSGCALASPAALLDALHGGCPLATLELGGIALGEDDWRAVDALRARLPALDVAVDKRADA